MKFTVPSAQGHHRASPSAHSSTSAAGMIMINPASPFRDECSNQNVYTDHVLHGYISDGDAVTKRLIDLDDELLETARRELGTTTITDTVRAALREAATHRARSRQIEWLTSGGLAPLADTAQREAVWR